MKKAMELKNEKVVAIYEGGHIWNVDGLETTDFRQAFFLLTISPQGKVVYVVTKYNLSYWRNVYAEGGRCGITDAEFDKAFVSDGVKCQTDFAMIDELLCREDASWSITWLQTALEAEGVSTEKIEGGAFIAYTDKEKMYLQRGEVTWSIRFDQYKWSERTIFDFQKDVVPKGLEPKALVKMYPTLISQDNGRDAEDYFDDDEPESEWDLEEAWEHGYGCSDLLRLDFADWTEGMLLSGGLGVLQTRIGDIVITRLPGVEFNLKLRFVPR